MLITLLWKQFISTISEKESSNNWKSIIQRKIKMSIRCDVVHNFIQQSLNTYSAQVQVLLAACRRFAMVSISGNGPS